MERGTFRQEGIVDWRRLPVGLMLQLGPILLTGAILAALSVAELYIIILVPVFVTIIPAMLSAWIAWWMKWRHPLAAGTVGFVLGALAYLSQFYVLSLYWRGLGDWLRFDLVLTDIDNFVKTVRIGDEVDPTKASAVLLVETLAFSGVFALAHKQVTQNLYCPHCTAPLKKKSSILPPDFAAALAEGIATGNMDDLPKDESGGEIEGDAWSAVEVLYCFHGGEKAEPLFYLTLRETRFAEGVGANFLMFDKVLLSADEMIAIGEKCPGLLITPSSASQSVASAEEAASGDSAD
jgi:hypothetical protein